MALLFSGMQSKFKSGGKCFPEKLPHYLMHASIPGYISKLYHWSLLIGLQARLRMQLVFTSFGLFLSYTLTLILY